MSSLPLLLSLVPIAAYEAYAIKTRRVPTITEAVRNAPRWIRVPLVGGFIVLFSHLFIGKP